MTKIFVGSLPYKTTNEDLGALFSPFGEVATATVVMDKFTGRSRGFGFVEMPNDNEAQEAIKKLDGSTYEERSLAVSVARPREERPQGQGNFRRDNNFRQNRGNFNRDNNNY